MKTFLFNLVIYFIIFSVLFGILTFLFGTPAFVIIKLIASAILAYIKPILVNK